MMADDSKFGYGQQTPFDTTHEAARMQFAIKSMLAKSSTVKLVKVLAVDDDKRTLDVQIAVNQMDGNKNTSPHGKISGVPYPVIQNGKAAIQTTPAVGDIGIMVVADRDISAVKETKDIANPGSYRTMDAADGVYLFGLYSEADPEQFIKFTDDGIEISAKGGHSLKSTSAGGWVVDKLTVTGNLQIGGQILSQTGSIYGGDIATSGDVKAGDISVKNHHHTAQGAFAPTTPSQT